MTDPSSAQPDPAPAAGTVAERAPGWWIGSLRGTPVYLGRTWPILALVILLTFGPQVARVLPDLGVGAYLVALAYVLLLLVSVLVHEAAHAITAQAFGHRVHAIVADLMGGHTSYQSETNTPGRSALVAVVGPLANAVLALIGWFLVQGAPGPVAFLLANAFLYSNAFVAVFNLLPGLPLDGGFVLDALVWRITGNRTTGLLVAGWAGRVLVVLVVVYAFVLPLLTGQSPDMVSVLWGALLGSFLWQGASGAIQTAGVRRAVDRLDLASLAHPAAVLDDSATCAEAIAAFAQGAHAVAVAGADGHPVGVVDPRVLEGVPDTARAFTPVGAVVAAQPPGWATEHVPGLTVTDVLVRMATTGAGVVLLRDGAQAWLLDAGEIEAAAAQGSVGPAH